MKREYNGNQIIRSSTGRFYDFPQVIEYVPIEDGLVAVRDQSRNIGFAFDPGQDPVSLKTVMRVYDVEYDRQIHLGSWKEEEIFGEPIERINYKRPSGFIASEL